MEFKEIKASKKSLGKRRMICGAGINDADYIVQPVVNGKRVSCPFYLSWKSMINRCYSPRVIKSRPTYAGCKVCDEWLLFSTFKEWMKKQRWQGSGLDKDLIKKGNKLYSPETCVFVSSHVNGILHENTKTRGKFMLGVSLHYTGKFQASVCDNGKRMYLGLFDTEIEAHNKYINKKIKNY